MTSNLDTVRNYGNFPGTIGHAFSKKSLATVGMHDQMIRLPEQGKLRPFQETETLVCHRIMSGDNDGLALSPYLFDEPKEVRRRHRRPIL
jgi:hypothetical protein